MYRRLTETWDEYCRGYLQISKSEADQTVRLLEEFGPSYFDVSQLTRISPETYRAIAPAIRNGLLHCNGEAIPLTPGRRRKVGAAIVERGALPKRVPSLESHRLRQELQTMAHDSNLGERIEKLHDCRATIDEFEQTSSDQGLAESPMLFESCTGRRL